MRDIISWSYGVMVSTLDSESNNPSSNLGRTLFLLTQLKQYIELKQRQKPKYINYHVLYAICHL